MDGKRQWTPDTGFPPRCGADRHNVHDRSLGLVPIRNFRDRKILVILTGAAEQNQAGGCGIAGRLGNPPIPILLDFRDVLQWLPLPLEQQRINESHRGTVPSIGTNGRTRVPRNCIRTSLGRTNRDMGSFEEIDYLGGRILHHRNRIPCCPYLRTHSL